jgi:hypothetical protein
MLIVLPATDNLFDVIGRDDFDIAGSHDNIVQEMFWR